jgi:serine/threonine protein kinase
MRPDTCPPEQQLRELADGRLSDVEQSRLTAHLDSCVTCQLALEEAAAGTAPWLAQLREVEREQPAATSAYWPALREVEDELGVRTIAPRPPAGGDDPGLGFLAPSDQPGSLGRLDHFEVKGLVGRGGMGLVLKAFDTCLQRVVALKVLDPQLARDETARQRFIREARAAAAVTHEYVVTIHSVDEADGLPYLVMQYIAGETLQDRLDRVQGPLPLADAVRIAAQAAAGLAAAHAQGLVHRDIKPANILLSKVGCSGRPKPGMPAAPPPDKSKGDCPCLPPVVKITDFGLARGIQDARLTQTGFVAGTPLYMAPEQARGDPVDHRSDLFSLGSLLYAMCAGKAPFEGGTPMKVLRQVSDEEPRPVRAVNPQVPGWLADLIAALHAKDPAHRPQSAAEVATVLAENLSKVTPAGTTSRLRWRRPAPRRWPWVAGVAAAVAGLFAADLAGLLHLRPAMAALVGRAPAPDFGPRGPAARLTLAGNAGPVWAVAFNPAGDTLAMAIDDGTVKLWDPATGRVRATLAGHRGPVWAVAFSPDGKTLATASDDETVKLWDVAARQELAELKHPSPARAVAFGPDGQSLATGCRNGSVRVWDLPSRRERYAKAGHAGVVVALAVSRDGSTLVSAGGDKLVKVWDFPTGDARLTLTGHQGAVYALALAPDGQSVASGGWDKVVRLWDLASGNPSARLEGHAQDAWALAFAPDGKTLASAGEDRAVKLWDPAGGRELATLEGHGGTVYAVAFSPDGHTVASGSRDGTVKLWDVPQGR